MLGAPSGFKIEMCLRDATYEKDGLTYVDLDFLEWVDVVEKDLLRDSSECEHVHTICADCVDSWECDHIFRIVDDQGNKSGMAE